MDDNLIFGRNAVTELLKSGRSVNKIFMAEGSHDGSIQKIFALAKNAGVVVEFTKRDKLDKLCGGRHQGVAALARRFARRWARTSTPLAVNFAQKFFAETKSRQLVLNCLLKFFFVQKFFI